MQTSTVRTAALLGLIAAAAAACGTADSPPAADESGPAVAAAGDTGHAQGMAGMQADPAMMRRHAQEADSAVAAMRGHAQQMRQLSAAEQHDRIGEHVAHVSRMLGLMDRHMREMDRGMGMDDQHMGAMMGMSAAEHRRMMDEMTTLRAEAEQLQTASRDEVRQQMPEHLERLEGFVEMMERSAAHMAAH